MPAPAVDIWPDEAAKCPLCQGVICLAAPLITGDEAVARIGTLHSAMVRQRLNADNRPHCPHCKKPVQVNMHTEPRCQRCHRQAGSDGRTLGLVDGLCSMCTPDIGAALAVRPATRNSDAFYDGAVPKLIPFVTDCIDAVRAMKQPSVQPVVVDANMVRAIATEWKDSGHTSNIGQQLFLLLATAAPADEKKLNQMLAMMLRGYQRDQEALAEMWHALWMFAGWRRLYVKLDRAADLAVKTPCKVCGGAKGCFDHAGLADSEEKPWRECQTCAGDGTMAHTIDSNLILRVVRLKDNGYLRLAARGWMPN